MCRNFLRAWNDGTENKCQHHQRDDSLWKTTFKGRHPSLEDNLQLEDDHEQTKFEGKQIWQKDDLGRNTTFDEDNLGGITSLDGRRPLIQDNLLG